MRIIGGTNRGTALTKLGPGDPAAQLRPTTDRVRESLFNVLLGGRFGEPIRGVQVLDLFAGTGALGLEALSRGAAHASFVDNGRAAQSLLRANIAKLRRADDAQIITADARHLPPAPAPCGLIFLDPPYGKALGAAALDAAGAAGWIAPGALAIWEEARPQIAPAGFTLCEQRRYGDSWLTFLRADAG